jgi:hypothetical protein
MKPTLYDSTMSMEESDKTRCIDLISRDLRILMQLYYVSVINDELVSYGSLYDDFDGRLKPSEFNESMDRLSDCGIVKNKYLKIRKRWSYVYCITPEAMSFAKDIYEKVIV